MKDRLTMLLNKFYGEYFDMCEEADDESAAISEYLIDNGVIVPPCKLHDEVWFIAKKQGDKEFSVFYGHADCIDLRDGWKHVIISWTDYQDSYKHVTVFEDFGKTVFLSEEKANKALEAFNK